MRANTRRAAAKQIECFDFFLGIELGRKVLNMADNLSAALQGSTVSASEGQSLMSMTVTTLVPLSLQVKGRLS